jgi:hypothetical protein
VHLAVSVERRCCVLGSHDIARRRRLSRPSRRAYDSRSDWSRAVTCRRLPRWMGPRGE